MSQKESTISKKNYFTAEELGIQLGVSKCKAYLIIRDLNKELQAKGFLTIRGKIPIKYFKERFGL